MNSEKLKGLETLSIGYGAIVTLAAVPLALILSGNPRPETILPEYVYASIAPALGLFTYRTVKHGSDKTFNFEEGLTAAVSGIGFSVPLLVLSMVSAISRGDYSSAQKWIQESKDMETEVQRLVSELELSDDTHTQAMQLIGTVRDKDLTKGREIDELVGAVVYIAARENGEPRTLEEISDLLRASQREIGRAYRAVARNTDIRIIPPGPADHVDRFAEKLGLSDEVKEKALELLEEAEDEAFISGKSHTGLAASALYLSAHMKGEERSLRETSDVLDVTTVTIRERSKDFIRNLELDEYPEHFEESLEE